MTPEERARKGGQATASKYPGEQMTKVARKKFMDRFKTEEEKHEYFRKLAEKRWSHG